MHLFAKSQLPAVQWPSIATGLQAELMSLQFQMQRHEQWSGQEIQKWQLKQALDLLSHACHTTPFYQDLYRRHTIEPSSVKTMASWRDLPVVSREQVRHAGDKMLSNSVPDQHVKAATITTSGSTGRPITVQTTQICQLFGNALTLRQHRWNKRDLSKKLAVIKHFHNGAEPPKGTQYNQWGPATGTIYNTGPCVCLSIAASVSQQLTWLNEQRPDYLLTYPSNLMALISYAERNQLALPTLLAVQTLGEVVTDELRARCQEKLGLRVDDAYSCQEVGNLAFQCPNHEHYHVQSENVLLEVLNAAGGACKAGEVGRVVITSLHNYANPLIRYEIGDYAEVGECCDCGMALPVLKKIQGRTRNMLVYPTGQMRWPFVGSSDYQQVADIEQFQLIQTHINKIEMHFVSKAELTLTEQAALTDIIQKALGHKFELEFVYQKEIARSAGGKFEDFISKVVL